ncbi:MAG TPA: TonB-dependent receptor [Povalibacter sp.]
MNTRRSTLIGSAVAFALLHQAAPATAQTAAGAEKGPIEEVIVSGIRQSLQKSLEVKREADSHVDVITAEDVGKMPDKNVADSLMRVPGVTISSAGANEGGFDENDRVSMRGTNPSLTQTLINGHAVSSGDWFVLNQTGTVGRSVTYTLLPSELVGRVVVHKSSQASDIEGGVAGAVDIQTRKPLDFAKSLGFEVSAGAVYAEQPDKTDPQFSGIFNWKNDDNTFGVLVQGFSEERHLRRDGQELLGYERIAAGSPIATAHPDLANVWYPTMIGSALFEQERKRRGGLVDVQFAPTDDLSFELTGFLSEMDAPNYNRNYLLWNTHFITSGTGQSPLPGYVVRNGTLVSASFAPVAGTTYGVYDQISRPDASSSSTFVDLDMNYRVSDAWSLHAKAGTTEGHGETPTQDVAEWNTGVGYGGGYSLNGIDNAASWSLGNETTGSNVNNGLGWIFGDQNIDVKDDEQYAQIEARWSADSGALSSIQFGARYSDHNRESAGVIGQGPKCADGTEKGAPFNWGATYFCDVDAQSPFNPANFPQGFANYPGDFGSGLGGTFPRDVWYFSPGQLADYNDTYSNRDPVTRSDWNSNYLLEEENTAAFVQANFKGDRWSADVGLRFVETKEHVVANVGVDAVTPGAITTSAFGPYLPTTFDNTYQDWLPSANFKYELSDSMVTRFAVSKTMTRPDYSALAGPISLSPALQSGSGSNPNLEPVRSTNVDATIEWYFAPRALLSATAFYMDLTSYVGMGQVERTFLTYSNQYPQGIDIDYTLSVPVNSSGEVKGVELAYEQPIAEYFGVSANYTYADGEEDTGVPLIGTSKNTYNLGAYFENERFNARASYTFRSHFYSGLDRSTAFSQDDVDNLSMSLGMKVTDSWSVSLDALNLNNPTLRYYALNQDQPRSIYQSGRQYYLNIRAKF